MRTIGLLCLCLSGCALEPMYTVTVGGRRYPRITESQLAALQGCTDGRVQQAILERRVVLGMTVEELEAACGRDWYRTSSMVTTSLFGKELHIEEYRDPNYHYRTATFVNGKLDQVYNGGW